MYDWSPIVKGFLLLHFQLKDPYEKAFTYRVSHKRRPIAKIFKINIFHCCAFLIITETFFNFNKRASFWGGHPLLTLSYPNPYIKLRFIETGWRGGI